MGLSGAGKTHFMVNSYLEDSWQSNYRNGPKTDNNSDGPFENQVRIENLGYNPKFVALLPTYGFN